jgi:hypothetical protein
MVWNIIFYLLQNLYLLTCPMILKYQHEINNFKLTISCPQKTSPISKSIYAYRFSFDPISHSLNFLPNVVFDRQKPNYFNYAKASATKQCSRCGASFYLSKPLAINNWNALSDSIRNNLGYTNLAYGILQVGDGLVGQPNDSSHFGFYEAVNATYHNSFKVIDPI